MESAEPAAPDRDDRQPTVQRPPGTEDRGRQQPAGAPPRAQGRPGAGAEARRRGDRRPAGFGDGIERAFCAALRHVPPPAFPVQHRTGCATLRPFVVARRPDAVLYCDGAHPGPHRWPDGDEVPEAEPDATSG